MNPSIKLLIDVLTRFFTVIAGTWLTKKGFSEEDTTFILSGLGVLLATLIWALARNFSLWKQSPPQKPTDPTISNWSQLIAFFVLVPALLMVQMGCSSPTKRYVAAMVALDGANTAFVSAANAKLLTDHQIVAAEPFFTAADRQVQILREEYETNGTVNETALKSLENAISAIEEWLTRVKSRK